MSSLRFFLALFLLLLPGIVYSVDSCVAIFAPEEASRGFEQNWRSIWSRHPQPDLQRTYRELPLGEIALSFPETQIVTRMTSGEISRLAYDDGYALRLAQSYDGILGHGFRDLVKAVRTLQLVARILYMRQTVDLSRLPVLTEAKFREQAFLARHEVRTFPFASRFDQRSPDEIREAGGFYPKTGEPTRRVGLLEHSLPDSRGGPFVSATLKEDHFDLLRLSTFERRQISQAEGRELLLGLGLKSDHVGKILGIRSAYEYRIRNVKGIQPEFHGVGWEKEIVTYAIRLEDITAYRHVRLIEFLSPEDATEGAAEGAAWFNPIVGNWTPLKQ